MTESWLHEFEAALKHMGQCEIHNILYVEVDPTKPKGCPRCAEEESKKDCN